MSAAPGHAGFLNAQAACNPPHAWQRPNLLMPHEGAKHSQILSEALGNAGQSQDGVIKLSPSWKKQRPLIRVGSKAAQQISLCHSVHMGA